MMLMAANIEGQELYVADSWESKDGNKALKSRIVRWVIDGQPKSVVLERREFFRGTDGEMKMGKAKGFSLKDLEALKVHWPRIMDILKNPPPFGAPPAQGNDGEVPF